MADNINLLPQQNEANARQSRQKKLLNVVSAVILVVTIVTVIALFVVQMVLGQQLNGVEQKIAAETERIQSMKTEEGIQRSLVSRVQALDTFFNSQKHYSQFINEFNRSIPSTLRVTDLVVAEDGEVSVEGLVANYADLTGFYTMLRLSGAGADAESGTNFTNTRLISIGRDDDSGEIVFGMRFNINPALLTSSADTTPTGGQE